MSVAIVIAALILLPEIGGVLLYLVGTILRIIFRRKIS
jgi:hypothetical protein